MQSQTTQQAQQVFTLSNLTAQDVEMIMTGLNELQAKLSRPTMNKVETQIIQQVQAQQATQKLAAFNAESKAKGEKVAPAAE